MSAKDNNLAVRWRSLEDRLFLARLNARMVADTGLGPRGFMLPHQVLSYMGGE